MTRALLAAAVAALLASPALSATLRVDGAEAFALRDASVLFVNASLEGFGEYDPGITRILCQGSAVRAVFFLTPPLAGAPSRLKAAALVPGTPPARLSCHLAVGSKDVLGTAELGPAVAAPTALALDPSLAYDNSTAIASLAVGTRAPEVYAGLFPAGSQAPFRGRAEYTYHCGRLGAADIPCRAQVRWPSVGRDDAKGLEGLVVARSGRSVGYAVAKLVHRGVVASLSAEEVSRSTSVGRERMVEEVGYEARVYGRRHLNLTIIPYVNDTLTLLSRSPRGERRDVVAVSVGRPIVIGSALETDQAGSMGYELWSPAYRYLWNATLSYQAGRPFSFEPPSELALFPGERRGIPLAVTNLRPVPGLVACASGRGVVASVGGEACRPYDVAPGEAAAVEVSVELAGASGGNVTVALVPPDSPEGNVTVEVPVRAAPFRDFSADVACEWVLGRVRCMLSINATGNMEDLFYYTIAPEAMSDEPLFASTSASGPASKDVVLYDVPEDRRRLVRELDTLLFYASLAQAEPDLAKAPQFADALLLADRLRAEAGGLDVDRAAAEGARAALAKAASGEAPLPSVVAPVRALRAALVRASAGALARTADLRVLVLICDRPYQRAGAAIVRCVRNETTLSAQASLDFDVEAPELVRGRTGREVAVPVTVRSTLASPTKFEVLLSGLGPQAQSLEGMVEGSRTFTFQVRDDAPGDHRLHATASPAGRTDIGRTATVVLRLSSERVVALEAPEEAQCPALQGRCSAVLPVSNRGTDALQLTLALEGEGCGALDGALPEALPAGASANLTASLKDVDDAAERSCTLSVVPDGNASLARRVRLAVRPVRSSVLVRVPPEVESRDVVTVENRGDLPARVSVKVPGSAYECVSLSHDEFTVEAGRLERVKLVLGSCPLASFNLTVTVDGEVQEHTVRIKGARPAPAANATAPPQGNATAGPARPPAPEGGTGWGRTLLVVAVLAAAAAVIVVKRAKATSRSGLAPVPGGKAEAATAARAQGPQSYYTKAYRTYYTYTPPPL